MYFPIEDFRNLQKLLAEIDAIRAVHIFDKARPEWVSSNALFEVFKAADKLAGLRAAPQPPNPREDGATKKEAQGPNGMSLRDYFAGQALIALQPHLDANRVIAASAFGLADAMLEARGR